MQPRQPHLRERVLRLEQGLLGLQHGHEIDGSLTQPCLGNLEGAAGGDHCLLLQPFADRVLLDRGQGILHVGEAGDHRFAVVLQQLVLPSLGEIELPLQPQAVEDRLRQAGGQIEERRFRPHQGAQRRTLIAAFTGQGDARQHRRARILDIEACRGERRFRLADIGTLRDQFRRQAGRDARHRDRAQAAAADGNALRRPCGEQRERIGVLPQREFERRHGGFLRREQALLLRGVELGCGAGIEPLADEVEHALRAGDVAPRHRKAILRRQHLEIGVRRRRHGGERDHVAVEPGCHRAFLGGAERRAVLAPEVDLVAAAQ